VTHNLLRTWRQEEILPKSNPTYTPFLFVNPTMTTKSGSPKPSHVPPEPRDEQIGHDDDAELTLLQKVTNYVWATAVLCLASYGLHEIDFLNVLLASDKVNHTIIKVGLAMSVMLLFTKVYMEVSGLLRPFSSNDFAHNFHSFLSHPPTHLPTHPPTHPPTLVDHKGVNDGRRMYLRQQQKRNAPFNISYHDFRDSFSLGVVASIRLVYSSHYDSHELWGSATGERTGNHRTGLPGGNPSVAPSILRSPFCAWTVSC